MPSSTAVKERPILFSTPMVRAILDGRKTQTRRIIKLDAKTILAPEQRKSGWQFSLDHTYIGDVGAMLMAVGGKSERLPRSQQISIAARHPEDTHIDWPDCGYERVYCPYGSPWDRLWVRESWSSFRAATPEENARREQLWESVKAKRIGMTEAALAMPKTTGDEQFLYRADFDALTARDLGLWKPSIHMTRMACRLVLEISEVRVERLQDISLRDAWAEGIRPEGVAESAGDGTWDSVDPQTAVLDDFRRLWESINGPGSWDANPWVWVITFKRIEVARA